jgi:hypothetical protein
MYRKDKVKWSEWTTVTVSIITNKIKRLITNQRRYRDHELLSRQRYVFILWIHVHYKINFTVITDQINIEPDKHLTRKKSTTGQSFK